MAGRLNASLCLPHGTLKSTTGVCLVVFLPSIQTSDHGTELMVIEQSPPPESSVAHACCLRGAGVSSEGASPVPSSLGASRWRRFLAPAPAPGDATAPPP